MNAKTTRLDPRRITPVKRTYLRGRMGPDDTVTPRIFAAVMVLTFGLLLLSL